MGEPAQSVPAASPASAPAPGRRRARQKGWWIPWLFVAGFGVVLAVNLTLLFFATSTFNGLVSPTAYEQGLAYNSEIAAQRAQETLGWQGDVDLAVRPGGREGAWPAVVSAELRDAEGRPLGRLEVTADLRRPTQAGFDQTVTLTAGPDGRWQAPLTLPFAGLWEVRLMARSLDPASHGVTDRPGAADATAFRLRRRVVVSP